MNSKQRSIADGWIELESDPGLFTLLIEDFGVKNVEVEEVYDLQSSIDGPVFGFILLFKWLEGGRRKRRNSKFELAPGSTVTDESIVNSIFFAHQIIMNSCATHAILSILMNRDDIDLGPTLTKLKNFTSGMSSENKGSALNNIPELVLAHNKHARPDACRDFDDESSDRGSSKSSSIATKKSTSSSSSNRWQETYHFASFLPVSGHLYEMDSLKPYPIDHGIIPEGVEWHHHFLQLLYDRIVTDNEGESHEIRYNLMALVPRRLDELQEKMEMLINNRIQLIEATRLLVSAIDPDVFRRKLRMISYTSRKKLSDSEILQAAHYLLAFGTETSPAASRSASNSRRSSMDRASTQETGGSTPSTTATEILSDHSQNLPGIVNNNSNGETAAIAEVECISDTTTVLLSDLLTTRRIENYEVYSAPASHSCAIDKDTIDSTKNEETISDKLQVVELSVQPSLSLSVSDDLEGNATSSNSSAKSAFICTSNMPPRRLFIRLKFEADENQDEQPSNDDTISRSQAEPLTLKELVQNYVFMQDQISEVNRLVEDQQFKKRNYIIDDQRRTHDYDQFMTTFFSMMLEHGLLPENDERPVKPKRRKSSGGSSQRPKSNVVKKRIKV